MKITILILSTIIISHAVNAQQTCNSYITDEWPDSRYIIESLSGENVVTDNKTGLMWKQCSEGLSGNDCNTGKVSFYIWKQALTSADKLNLTGFAGFTDWRLPNIKELRSLAKINCYNPAINETVFPNTPSNIFWSSSPVADVDRYSWVLRFEFGRDYTRYRTDYLNPNRVRLVRSGQ